MQNEKPSYFAMLPASVRYDKTLSPLEKLLFAEITSLSTKEGFCWAGNAYFAEIYDRDPTHISKVLSKLAKKGYIHIEIDQAAGNRRKITIALALNHQTYSQKVQDPYSQKVQHNKEVMNIETNKKTNTERDEQLAGLLHELILLHSPHWPYKPGPRDFDSINKLHRIDGYPYELIEVIIRWCQQDNFWSRNILSAAKLRKQFAQLVTRAKAEHETKKGRVVQI